MCVGGGGLICYNLECFAFSLILNIVKINIIFLFLELPATYTCLTISLNFVIKISECNKIGGTLVEKHCSSVTYYLSGPNNKLCGIL